MDEPLAALDAPRQAEALGLFERVRDAFGVPILYVSHAMEEVDRLADTLVLMEDGRVVAAGPIEELTARADLPLLAGRRDAGSVVSGRVESHDARRGLTRIAFEGGTAVVTLRREPPGARVRLRLRARGHRHRHARPPGISINNVLPARIEARNARASMRSSFGCPRAHKAAGPHHAGQRLRPRPRAGTGGFRADQIRRLRPGRTGVADHVLCHCDDRLLPLLREDCPYGDPTTLGLGIGGQRGRAVFATRRIVTACCTEEAERLMLLAGCDSVQRWRRAAPRSRRGRAAARRRPRRRAASRDEGGADPDRGGSGVATCARSILRAAREGRPTSPSPARASTCPAARK